MPPQRSQARGQSQPRRIHHYVSMSFSAPQTVYPQLYEWVSSGFPFSAVVHHFTISTTHPTASSSSLPSSETPTRLSYSTPSSAGSDPDPNDSLLNEFDNDVEGYVSPTESSLEELRKRLHRLAGEGEARGHTITRRDPWTTWFPPTPPLRSREGPRSEPTTPILLFSSPSVAPSVLLHALRMYRSDMNEIEEDEMEAPEEQLQQESGRVQSRASAAQSHALGVGLPDDEAEFAQLFDDGRSSPQGFCLCWVCRAVVQRYARRHNVFR